MIEKNIEIEAESLENARELVKSQIPEDFHIISERIISDGKPQTTEIRGDTTEAALAKLQSELPNNVEIIEQKEISAPELRDITVEAYNEQTAQEQAKRYHLSKGEVVKSVEIAVPGSKGFLGIGKKPNKYEIEVLREAVVSITYKTKVKVSTKIGKLEPEDITLLVKEIKNVWKGKEAQQEAAEKLVRYDSKTAIKHLLNLLQDEQISVREIAIISLQSISTKLPETVIQSLKQAAEKHQNDLEMIEQQRGPLIELLTPLEGKYTINFSKFPQYMKIREIGEEINKIGGQSAMWILYYHIKAQHKNSSFGNSLDYCWDGIGTWRR